MARGRMLNKRVSMSKQMDDLPDDTCRLMATWTLAHLDVRGVFHADPVLVRSTIFPRRQDVTLDHVEKCLDAMEHVGLIVRFEADDEMWQWWPKFMDNQQGLRPDRETTNFPEPPELCGNGAGMARESVRQDDGTMYAEEKLSEDKGTKGKSTTARAKSGATRDDADPPPPPSNGHHDNEVVTDAEFAPVYRAWCDLRGGMVTPTDHEILDDLCKEYGANKVKETIRHVHAEGRRVRHPNYIRTVLEAPPRASPKGVNVSDVLDEWVKEQGEGAGDWI